MQRGTTKGGTLFRWYGQRVKSACAYQLFRAERHWECYFAHYLPHLGTFCCMLFSFNFKSVTLGLLSNEFLWKKRFAHSLEMSWYVFFECIFSCLIMPTKNKAIKMLTKKDFKMPVVVGWVVARCRYHMTTRSEARVMPWHTVIYTWYSSFSWARIYTIFTPHITIIDMQGS